MRRRFAPPLTLFATGRLDPAALDLALGLALAGPGAARVRGGLGWTTGRCRVLAVAFAAWAGPRASLWVVEHPGPTATRFGTTAEHVVEHVLARVDGWFVDGDGLATEAQARARAAAWLGVAPGEVPLLPWAEGVHREGCRLGGAFAPPARVRGARALLADRLGPAERWGLGPGSLAEAVGEDHLVGGVGREGPGDGPLGRAERVR